MTTDNKSPTRKHYRLPGYDYSTPGAYFITICTKNREHLLSTVTDGGFGNPPIIRLTPAGKAVENAIAAVSSHYKNVAVDKYAIMPNHVHILFSIGCGAEDGVSISRVIQHLKGAVTKAYGYAIWQEKSYDHVIRGKDDYKTRWKYIDDTPSNWLLHRDEYCE